MSNRKKQLMILNIISVLALLVVILPLLLISKYNYPSADDWSFGAKGYEILQSGGGFLQLLKATFATMQQNYQNWEGRFSAVFFCCPTTGNLGRKVL